MHCAESCILLHSPVWTWQSALMYHVDMKIAKQLLVTVTCCKMLWCWTCRQARGFTHYLAALLSFGIALLTPFGMDTHHHCPGCNKFVAVAKLM